MAELKGLDAWITSGRYAWEYLRVTCNHCDEVTIVKAEQEYGSVWWTPDECGNCGIEFDKNVTYEEDYMEQEYNPEDDKKESY